MEVATRAFVRRTRRGKVRRVVREHYLRDDILTGSPRIDAPHLEPRLSPDAPRYLVPDANVLLHQIDVMEHPALQDVILLQTVLAEVRHRRVALYNRARAIAADPKRRCVVFCNEHARETYVSRAPGESANDYNDRAIRTAVGWYAAQLEGSVEVLLLTNDRDNLRKARAAGLSAQTVHHFAREQRACPDLADRLAGEDDDGGDAGGEAEGGNAGADGRPDAKRARRASSAQATTTPATGSGSARTLAAPVRGPFAPYGARRARRRARRRRARAKGRCSLL